jgi:erythronate-4-phosphate dehydrogenase
LENNLLRVDEAIVAQRDVFQIAKALIKQVYDIAADDARLRAVARQARAGELNFAEGFDGLRKHYPKRREFHNYRVSLPGLGDADKNWLKVLGFNCV